MCISEAKILELIKQYFPDFKFESGDFRIDKKNDVIKIVENNEKIEEDLLYKHIEKKYFKKSNSGDTFYHFVPLKYVFPILEKEGKIRMYNLNKYLKDDSTEFSYFLERLGIKLPKPKEQIKSVKENIFIFSCTTDNISDKQWQRFGETEKVVCLKLKINFNGQKNYAFDIRKVAYATELSKLFCLQESIIKNYNKKLEIQGWSCFAKFMKRGYFDWEKEIRLCFDKSISRVCNKIGMPSSDEDVYCDNGTSYIEMQLINDSFELKVEEVQVREDNWQGDLKSFCKSEGLNFKIDKLKLS